MVSQGGKRMAPELYDTISAIFKVSRHAIIVKNSSYEYVFLSDQACHLIGLRFEELAGKTDFDFLPEVEAEQIREVDCQILRSGEERLFEEEITARDGSHRMLVTHKRRVSLSLGDETTHLIVAVIEDVTELRRAEEVLRASEEHHRALIELHPQTPWVANPAGEVVEIGLEWEQLSGRSVDDASGHGWATSVHPEDLPWVQGCWREATTSITPLDVEYRIWTRERTYRWYRNRAAPKLDPSGEVLRWYGLLEDVHDRRTALEALIESERRLREHGDKLEKLVDERTEEVNAKNAELAKLLQQEREVNALQRRFVAMVSHEFRTPLTIIDAAAQRLARLKSPPTAEYLAEKSTQIKGSVGRMVDLMESILAAGRLETGVIEIKKAPCSLAEIIRDAARKRQEISAGHCIHVDLDLPPVMEIDEGAFERVLTNLLSNAVKYSPASPDINVRGWIDGVFVRVSVSDNGIGMDAEDIPRLFEPYFRAQSATGIAGTGIGLNIVREIVHMHGGTIGVESSFGEGSTFTVTLPYPSSDSTPPTGSWN